MRSVGFPAYPWPLLRSADPSKGGMDCSGFIYFALREAGFSDVPRQSNEQYVSHVGATVFPD